jgi:hypothetical protein
LAHGTSSILSSVSAMGTARKPRLRNVAKKAAQANLYPQIERA